MLRRDVLGMFATAATGGIVLPAWLLAKADELEVTMTDAQWRSILTPAHASAVRSGADQQGERCNV